MCIQQVLTPSIPHESPLLFENLWTGGRSTPFHGTQNEANETKRDEDHLNDYITRRTLLKNKSSWTRGDSYSRKNRPLYPPSWRHQGWKSGEKPSYGGTNRTDRPMRKNREETRHQEQHQTTFGDSKRRYGRQHFGPTSTVCGKRRVLMIRYGKGTTRRRPDEVIRRTEVFRRRFHPCSETQVHIRR